MPCVSIESSTNTLTPIPPTTSDALIIPPNDFARVGKFLCRYAFFHGVEHFSTVSSYKTRGTHIGLCILPSNRDCIFDTDGVVEIHYGINAG
ncbi:hypothetical protein D3C72_1775930 [compost metagenome]